MHEEVGAVFLGDIVGVVAVVAPAMVERVGVESVAAEVAGSDIARAAVEQYQHQ